MLHIAFTEFPVLQTERLVLRRIREADADELYRLRSHPEVMKYLDRPAAKDTDEMRAFIQRIADAFADDEGITWVITEKNDDRLIGTIGYWRLDKENHRAEIGYMLQADKHGKGLMPEALAAVLDYGFRGMKLHSVEANVNPHNEASIRLLERNGFVKEAHFKENYYYDGKFLDSVIYSLLTPLRQTAT